MNLTFHYRLQQEKIQARIGVLKISFSLDEVVFHSAGGREGSCTEGKQHPAPPQALLFPVAPCLVGQLAVELFTERLLLQTLQGRGGEESFDIAKAFVSVPQIHIPSE